MSVYLDASVLIAYLYQDTDDPTKATESQKLFDALADGQIQATVAFYSFSELYGYVNANYPVEQQNEVFRASLVSLFNIPLIIKPFVERVEHEKLRRRFTLRDATDIPHVVAALAFQCSAIITFDHHFQRVRDVIPVFTPAEYLASLIQSSGNE